MFGFELETLKILNRRRLEPLAFQANDAGSIPATRSISFNLIYILYINIIYSIY